MKFDKYLTNGAYHYKWYDDPNWAWYKECVDTIVEFCNGVTIDVGGGDGVVASKLMEKGCDVVVLENEPTALDILRQKNIVYQDVDLDKISDDFGHDFDYVCSLNVLEHLNGPESHLQLIKSAQVGAIVITDKATDQRGRYHEHEYSKEELLETFSEFNPEYFEINSTEYDKPITFIGVKIKKESIKEPKRNHIYDAFSNFKTKFKK